MCVPLDHATAGAIPAVAGTPREGSGPRAGRDSDGAPATPCRSRSSRRSGASSGAGRGGRSCRVISFFALLRTRPPSLNARPSLCALSTSAQGAGKGKKRSSSSRRPEPRERARLAHASAVGDGESYSESAKRQVRGEDAPARSEDAPWRGASSRPGGPFLSNCFCLSTYCSRDPG